MKLVGVFFFLLLEIQLFGRYCYSIETTVDKNTPVSPIYQEEVYQAPQCNVHDGTYLFSSKRAFIGCYKSKEKAKKILDTSDFPFKNPKIVYHKLKKSDIFVIFPKAASVSKEKALQKLEKVYNTYDIEKLEKSFPKKFYGNGIDILPAHSISFLPFINLYTLYSDYKKQHSSLKILILYDGVYNIETLYKKLHNENYIKKRDENTYEIKIPIIISSTAKLVISNKTIYLQTKPKPIAIFYFGKLYCKDSKFYTWDMTKDAYAQRDNVAKDKALFFNYESSRPYFTALADSGTYFINNIFKGLGFHSTSATFGLGIMHFSNDRRYFSSGKAFNYFIAKNGYPNGYYIGNDVVDGSMAFYTNGAKNVVYLGNYTYDNHIYNFDPHDYSDGLVIASNLSTRAQLAHGIIISRGVDNSIIANNISINNHSAGIMIDRTSNHNIIYNNISLANGYMGISIQESDDILIENNIIALNKINGIMSRNSLKISIIDNNITNNGKSGIEILSKNIDHTLGRDFVRDPYPKASSAVVKNNFMKNNYRSDIIVKNSAAIALENNILKDTKRYEGDLNFFNDSILKTNGKFLLYGRGFPYKSQSRDLRQLSYPAMKVAIQIYDEMQKSNPVIANDMAIVALKSHQYNTAKKFLQQAAIQLTQGSLEYLGYLYLVDAKKRSFYDKEKIIEGLTLLVEDMILRNPRGDDLKKVVYFIPNGRSFLKRAYERAKERMLKGEIFSQEAYQNSEIAKSYLTKEQKKKIRLKIQIFLYKMKLAKASSFIDYLQVLYRNFSVFSPNYMYSLQKRIDKHNSLQDDVTSYYRNRNNVLSRDLMCRKKQEQDAYFKEQTDALLKQVTPEQIEEITPQLKKQLAKINRYRKRKISLQELYELLGLQRGVK